MGETTRFVVACFDIGDNTDLVPAVVEDVENVNGAMSEVKEWLTQLGYHGPMVVYHRENFHNWANLEKMFDWADAEEIPR